MAEQYLDNKKELPTTREEESVVFEEVANNVTHASHKFSIYFNENSFHHLRIL